MCVNITLKKSAGNFADLYAMVGRTVFTDQFQQA